MERCIICGNTSSFVYRDFRGNIICSTHKEYLTCAGCSCFLPSRFSAKCVGIDTFLCDSCSKSHVTENNMETFVKQTMDILYKAGFQDIQRDWITIKIISRTEMKDLIKSMSAVGVHYEQSPSQLTLRGRCDFDQTVNVLDYLSPIVFMEVLAHEMVHAWQAQNNLPDYFEYEQNTTAKNACEGFANIGSYLVYDSFDNIKFNLDIRRFVQYKKSIMLLNDDPAYGVSFKKILDFFPETDKNRWHKMIKAARNNKIREIITL